jgi:hypothetical protein|tara:strand:+ start:492 stop:626 length:135 start_codon:yes stop_codon:yes gene_type:complete
MNCLTENGKHIMRLEDKTDTDNYYICTACGLHYRINKDLDGKEW